MTPKQEAKIKELVDKYNDILLVSMKLAVAEDLINLMILNRDDSEFVMKDLFENKEDFYNIIMKEFLERELFSMNRGLVATPNSREDLEAFAKANGGSMDIILMQMAINFGYKIALENVKEELEKTSTKTKVRGTIEI